MPRCLGYRSGYLFGYGYYLPPYGTGWGRFARARPGLFPPPSTLASVTEGVVHHAAGDISSTEIGSLDLNSRS